MNTIVPAEFCIKKREERVLYSSKCALIGSRPRNQLGGVSLILWRFIAIAICDYLNGSRGGAS
jgi:hypothetical protein